ncbi:hypothetical protein, partial [Photobacterium alginatilyticum]|uniref:hypothetical protein n=1 Tax=Photobacterium alginatilyticum TaxID=1775171 RepID=UPI001964E995
HFLPPSPKRMYFFESNAEKDEDQIDEKEEIEDKDDGQNYTCSDLSAIDDTYDAYSPIPQTSAPKAPILNFTIQYGGKYVGFATHQGVLDSGGAANLMPTSEYYEGYGPLHACNIRLF